MGSKREPLTPEERMPPELSHRRILFEMCGVIAVGSLVGFAFFSSRSGFGVLIGGVLAFVNYFWQKRSLKAIFDRAVHGEKSRFLALRYVLRYVAIAAVLAAVYFSETVSMIAVVFGLASFAVAVVVEGFISIFSSSS